MRCQVIQQTVPIARQICCSHYVRVHVDTIIHFVFWGLVEYVFFRVGRFVLWCASFGRVKLETPTPLQLFLVALIGLFLTIVGVVKLLSFQ